MNIIKRGNWGFRVEHKYQELRSLPFRSLLAILWLAGTLEAASVLRHKTLHFHHRDVWNFKSGLLISDCWLLGAFSWPTWLHFKMLRQCNEDGSRPYDSFSLPALDLRRSVKCSHHFQYTPYLLVPPLCPRRDRISRAHGYCFPRPLCVCFEKVGYNTVMCCCSFFSKHQYEFDKVNCCSSRKQLGVTK